MTQQPITVYDIAREVATTKHQTHNPANTLDSFRKNGQSSLTLTKQQSTKIHEDVTEGITKSHS